jgi:hypothetical protein
MEDGSQILCEDSTVLSDEDSTQINLNVVPDLTTGDIVTIGGVGDVAPLWTATPGSGQGFQFFVNVVNEEVSLHLTLVDARAGTNPLPLSPENNARYYIERSANLGSEGTQGQGTSGSARHQSHGHAHRPTDCRADAALLNALERGRGNLCRHAGHGLQNAFAFRQGTGQLLVQFRHSRTGRVIMELRGHDAQPPTLLAQLEPTIDDLRHSGFHLPQRPSPLFPSEPRAPIL